MVNTEERETHISYDHYTGEVRIFTTQKDVFSNFRKRLGRNNPEVEYSDNLDGTYSISLKELLLRKPYYVSPVIKQKKRKLA